MELIQMMAELQADLALSRWKPADFVPATLFMEAVWRMERQRKSALPLILKVEMLEEQEDEDDNILDFLHKSGSENRQLARNSLIILHVDMMSGEYKVSYRGSQRASG